MRPLIQTRRPVRTLAALALGATTLLGACTNVDPYTREEKVSNATKGTVIGAAAGAGAGALTSLAADTDTAKSALIGAGIGALGGGAVGYYMDRQEEKLRQRLDQTGVRVNRNGNQIQLVMPGNITFATDSARIQSDFQRVLQDVGLVLNEFQKTYIRVEGHTDSRGSADYNRELGRQRASSVIQYLSGQGVRQQRFILRSMGESQPIATNETAAGRQKNRRVELELIPHTRS
jgi:outer membrane protein OmpA-like peptidoglycan-associated protein